MSVTYRWDAESSEARQGGKRKGRNVRANQGDVANTDMQQ